MHRRLVVPVAVVALTAASLIPAYAAESASAPSGVTATGAEAAPERFVVVMKSDPLVARFGQEGLDTPQATAAEASMVGEQNAALASAGLSTADKIYTYTTALNGFAAELTATQAKKLEGAKGVARVMPDVLRKVQTDASPAFLGLSGPGGVWARTGYTGEGVIVGIIDTGIWPEHPSFADNGSYPPPGVVLENTAGNPSCNFGNTAVNPLDAPFTCQNKLIGARQMLATYRAVIGVEPGDYDSARDAEGHGTHTASTSAGNGNVQATLFGANRGTVSGIAPRAHVIAYKALGPQGGFTSDLTAAIDQAVVDGVDVINYSVGGGPSLGGADDIAFLFAADAGVFVAASAGNDGPGPGTIGGPATVPWLTAVGASTQTRFFQSKVRLGSGVVVRGASITPGTRALPLVDAARAGGDLCLAGTLNPQQVNGAIVLCRRGGNGRVAKSEAVAMAGGAGMILYNNDNADNLFTDNFYVPTVHLDYSQGMIVKNYLASGPGRSAQIIPDGNSLWPSAPTMTGFSSRGPDPVAEDIIKPDLTAPGMQILAGNTPTPMAGGGPSGQLFQSIAGTSMSSPHVAGALALVKQAHPDWSAAMAKSALMTTTYQQVKDNDRTSQATPFAMGSGHLDMTDRRGEGSPFNPGLVYDAGFFDYLGFMCDADPAVFSDPSAYCALLQSMGIPTEAVNLNYPSIGLSSVAGSVTVQRTVTNVSNTVGRYRARITEPAGFRVTVSPLELVVQPGQQATFNLTVTNVSAPNGTWRFGSLMWDGSGADVFSPIAARGSQFQAPSSVQGLGGSGAVGIPVKFGYTGPYSAAPHGLTPATVTNGLVQQDPDQTFDPNDPYNVMVPITVDGGAFLRVTLPPDGVPNPNTDLDLYLYDPNGALVGTSTAGATDEQIDIPNPMNGTYRLYVHGWQVVGGTSPFTLYDWVIPSRARTGNLSITSAPTSATMGVTATVTAAWTGAGAQWWLGAVSHSNAGGLMGLTLVEVDNRP